MSKLIYTAITSLDGYIEDEEGRFGLAVPDAEVHAFVKATVGTHLYGRRTYETMAVWQTVGEDPGLPVPEGGLRRGVAGPGQVVYSRTLDAVWTPRTRLEREFDPEAVGRLKEAAGRDISVSGPGLAEHAFRAGLVDEIHLFVFPIVVGGGKRGLPRGVRLNLELLDERRFGNGVVHLHHRPR